MMSAWSNNMSTWRWMGVWRVCVGCAHYPSSKGLGGVVYTVKLSWIAS